ncbi:NACHT domain-containing protein [Streptomyces narbonensis]|uniref:NACHT domain-containing protein n=1 Tax=Streptomyces narbonensis TaxID=67333 RepID=A0ABV3CFY5_9ACTN
MELSERTDLIAMVCAVLGGVAVLATLWRRPEEDEAAAVARLARAVKSIGEPQWLSSLGGDLKAIDVTFAFRPHAGVRAAALPASPAGRLERVVEDYRELRPRRMVITGEPGAGKTVLARKFVMKLIEVRGEDEPVPVLIALADWDAGEPFHDWLVRHLQHDYGLPLASARRIVAARMVLPVLDGLDEMDATGAEPEDSRAAQALDALGGYQDGTDPAPLVLTCRSREYDALEAAGSHILDAARLELAPVTPDQARDFLALRGARRPARWQPLLDHIHDRPSGVLARSLSTPWRLTLAAVAYQREGDPAHLLAAVSEREVADRLLARFIGASVANSPKGVSRYTSGQVHRTLRVLALSLGSGRSAGSDLTPLDLGRLVPRRAVGAVIVGTMAGAALLHVSVLLRWNEVAGPTRLVTCAGLLLTVVMGLTAGSLTTSCFRLPGVPKLGSSLWNIGLRRWLRKMPKSWSGAYLLVLLVFMTAAFLGGFPNALGLVLALCGGATLIVLALPIAAVAEIDRMATGPAGGLRAFVWLGAYFGGGVLMALTAYAKSQDPLMLTSLGLVLSVGVLMEAALLAYVLYLLLNRRTLPLRLARFLDWSVSAGLMRTSGAVYQFRHREFQEWLVRHPEP